MRQSLPADCPVCRRSWDDDCERELDVCVQKSGPVQTRNFELIVRRPPQPASRATRPTAPPRDFLPICCRHSSRLANSRQPENQRAMHYSSEWCHSDNVWKDTWVCYCCSNTFDRDLLFKFMLEVCPWAYKSFCPQHGIMALVVDCSDRSTLALGGRRCTRSFSTYNLVMQLSLIHI